VFSSSCAVYGDQPPPHHEALPPRCLSPYAAAKLSAEQLCRSFTQVYQLPTVCLRYFNVFGPRQNPHSGYAAAIPRFVTALLKGYPPTIYGDGLQSRDFVYVANVVEANLLACKAEAAVGEVFGGAAQVQRCQWHKRENVVRHLPLGQQATWRRKLQAGYEQPTYAKAKRALQRLGTELQLVNASAAKSLAEGLEETLTLHRLGLFVELGASFKTTNVLESVMAQVEQRTGKVDHWRTSEQKQRWCAAALLAIEARFRKVKGYRHLPRLVEALRRGTQQQQDAA